MTFLVEIGRRWAAALLTLFCTGMAQAAASYGAPVVVSRPGFAQSQYWGINDAGAIVGDSSGTGFLHANGAFTNIAPAGSIASGAYGISSSGLIVGTYTRAIPGGDVTRGFLLDQGVYTDFEIAGADRTTLLGISSDGRYLAGSWVIGASSVAYVYDRQSAMRTDISSLSPSGGGSAFGVNVHGVAVGIFQSSGAEPIRSFTFDIGSQTVVEVFSAGTSTRPRFRGINDQGLIAGRDSFGHSFVGQGADWAVIAAPAGFSYINGNGINNQGVVVGATLTASFISSAFIATPVPEPAQW
ncbi:MAG: hypothetical protein Q8L92_14410, partial [Rubrivivax sp.]|nr:hypothetical protein [Rubrivivax sp.]